MEIRGTIHREERNEIEKLFAMSGITIVDRSNAPIPAEHNDPIVKSIKFRRTFVGAVEYRHSTSTVVPADRAK
jgi:hypothetical protein